ncbi:phosphatidylinositol N-acetylglucosaminyltransferase subunit P-like [Dendronephthya gigantea]|uniref:phosphatidylinositol N-acetylglucosaminyltransferase subunit P-like n=1 Tax=Dendronephthya gigantea TaxID=151771 RepID=UPI0010693ADB|nr:phosphatidylinositol N-acetylglucosaminyltransferase subunit P-like [Dendronephthya gigantea]
MAEHSPSPTPERAIYGFVLYVATYMLFGLYISWAYLPESWLTMLGITYLPQRFWVFAGPLYCCVTLLFILFCYVFWNFLKTPPLDSISTLTDKFSRKAPEELQANGRTCGGVPPLGDIDIRIVNKYLYDK